MKNAAPVIDDLRAELTGEWSHTATSPFPHTHQRHRQLSTFHGCPAGEIEGIVTFLLAEMDCHVCVKLNPTLLGDEPRSTHLLHDVLGYREIQLHPAGLRQRSAIRRSGRPHPAPASPGPQPRHAASP